MARFVKEVGRNYNQFTPETGPGSGSVTSVALSAPTGFTVSGSPITTSGTLALSFTTGYGIPPLMTGNSGKFLTTNGTTMSWVNITGTDVTGAALTEVDDTNVTMTLGGTPSTALLRSVSMTLGWAGQLAVSRGGTGAATLTGVIIGNGTSAMTAVTGGPNQILRVNGTATGYEFYSATFLTNPMTLNGDMIAQIAGVPARIAGPTPATKHFLTSTGTGSAANTPTWQTLSAADITGSALTRTNDTNVTITLGGSASTALLNAASLTMGWTGQLSAGRGGTGTSGVSGVMFGNLTAPVTGITGIGGQILRINPSTLAYEFWSATYMDNPMVALGDLIYGNAAGAPLRLPSNSTGNNMYLRSVSAGTPAWASIAGSDITGAALTETDDTNVTMTLGGTPSNSLLRSVSMTLGWTGQLAVGRGGSGASTLTGVLIGNGTSAFTGVTGTANQILRRNAGNTAYEFYTPTFLTGSGTTNYIPKWTSSTVLGDSQIIDNGTNVGIGVSPSYKLDVNGNTNVLGTIFSGNVSSTNGSIMLQDNYSSGHLTNFGTSYSSGAPVIGFGVTPSTSTYGAFLSATTLTSYPRSAIVVDSDIYFYTGAAQTVAVGSSVSMLEVMRITNAGTLQVKQGDLQLPTTKYITWGGAYGTDIPTISGTSGSGSNGFLQFYPAGSTSGVKMALRRTGQLALPSYTTSTSFTGTEVATLAVTSAGDVITIAPAQTTASGTYTPTWTGLANVGSTTAFSCQYMRVGNTVTVSGWVTIDAVTDNTPTSLSFSLPINSNTSTVNYLNGTGVQQGGGAAASLSGYGANYGEFEVIPLVDTAINYSFHFTYRII